jgi:hypothetical protein
MIAAIILNLSGVIMEKWFRHSLMALGFLFIVFIELSFLSAGNASTFSIWYCLVFLAALSLAGISIISGIGLLLQTIGKGLSHVFGKKRGKAKRGLVDEDKMYQTIRRLSDEERAYLCSYLSAQYYDSYERLDDSYESRKMRNYG